MFCGKGSVVLAEVVEVPVMGVLELLVGGGGQGLSEVVVGG